VLVRDGTGPNRRGWPRKASRSERHSAPSGRGWAGRYNYAWLTSIDIYRLNGTVRYRQAYATR
jgi:hypothetical protein